ncbi:hypothetical protein BDEG_27184 [Batrachochytrium dendrobatidis JEL423]|uniref:Uncharacterized protein n=1 Tax=Batrachochytrium dendrobatidis (strain JEL423) TaxID=403673 RepID=A0A177WWM6_BATDL|nr:hypothetical protein BDEG_27184 [Batrachochytrium dendrobatidis JEL423]
MTDKIRPKTDTSNNHIHLADQISKMKLAVTVLSSILAICSVTTANPVNPSSATSTETSTSTAQPTEITSTVFEDRIISYEEATRLVDISQLSESDIGLIKDYLETDREYQEMKKVYVLVKSERRSQQKLIDQLYKEYLELVYKYQQNKNNPMCQEMVQNSKLMLKEAREKLKKLRKERLELSQKFFGFSLQSHLKKEKLAELLFGNDMDSLLLFSCMEFLESNRDFVESIYEFLILRLNQQSESEQVSTSEAQSLSSSSETFIVQPTQTSSSTQATSSSTQRASRRSRI